MNTSIEKKFGKLIEIFSSERFLHMEGLGGEVPYFVALYDASEQNQAEDLIRHMIKNLKTKGVSVLLVDLYDLSIEKIKNRIPGTDLLDRIISEEKNWSMEDKKKNIQALLNIKNVIIPAIESKFKKGNYDILFIKGCGEVFPYIRSHHILEQLQPVISDCPVVMFFPGEFKHVTGVGACLKLFSRIEDNYYYRAKDLDHYEI